MMALLGFRSADRFRNDIQELSEKEFRNLITLIKELSLRGNQIFTESDDSSQRLLYSFDTNNGQDASAVAAVSMLDERVREAKTNLVPDVISEQNFFYNYFSHIMTLLSKVFVNDNYEELQTSIRALVRVENCAGDLAKFSWELYGWDAAIEETGGRGRSILEPILARYECQGISKADIYTLAGALAVEEMGGPKVAWRPGRRDEDESDCYHDDTYFSQQEKAVLRWLQGDCKSFDNKYFEKKHKDEQDSWLSLYAMDVARFCQDFPTAYCKLQEYKFKFDGAPNPLLRRTSSVVSLEEEEEAPLKFALPDALEMFGFNASRSLESTKEWRHAATAKQKEILELVKRLTRRSLLHSSESVDTIDSTGSLEGEEKPKVNLHVFKTRHPETPASFTFSLQDELDRNAAIAAANVDENLTKFKPLLVPKISEAEFYSNYFSHVYHLRKLLGERSKPKVIRVYIGSHNPVKINACRRAFLSSFKNLTKHKKFEFIGVNAPSGVSDQPEGDSETKTGAINRAMYCKKQRSSANIPRHLNSEFYVGIEGGLTDNPEESNMCCFAWIAVLSNNESLNCSRTATFTIPPALASLVRKGIELGRADDIVHGKTNSKQKDGTVGTLTQGQIDRTAYYSHAVILALAPFANPNLHI